MTVGAHSSPTRLTLLLIRPSKYDDEGYVVRYRRGFLPSNTLACLLGLTDDARRQRALGEDLRLRVELLDDTVQPVLVQAIARRARRRGQRTVVCLAGVQTNQFPRASDLALRFRREGVDVLIGGFHVSGSVATLPGVPSELRALLDAGVSLVAGEVEGHWVDILRDAVKGKLRPIYDFLAAPPTLCGQPLPAIHEPYLRRFLTSNFGTIDAGRGCPFSCSFCTVINVHGRRMRCRDPDALLRAVRDNYHDHRVSLYFLTDDNFARNPHWKRILDGFISLREEEGLPLEFMMQADVLSYRIPDFARKARRAGCTQVFLGIESLRNENLCGAGKSHNDAVDLPNLVAAYHAQEIMTHAAYMIGFPLDTPASVRADVERLKQSGVKQASFFMLTPLPGSADHLECIRRGVPLDPDLSRYDAAHPTVPHPRMSSEEWLEAYQGAWRSFYSYDHMRNVLWQTSPERYWNVFKNLLWARISFEIEGMHPMMAGLCRRWERQARRPTLPLESRRAYTVRRVRTAARKGAGWVRLLLEMKELWLDTRGEARQPGVSSVSSAPVRSGTKQAPPRHRLLKPLRNAKLLVQFLLALLGPGVR